MAAIDSDVAATQALDPTVDSETAAVMGPDVGTAAPLDKMTAIDLKAAGDSETTTSIGSYAVTAAAATPEVVTRTAIDTTTRPG